MRRGAHLYLTWGSDRNSHLPLGMPYRDDSTPPPSLWGRANELELLQGLAATCQHGSGRVAIVTGPPGIGKTALVASLAAWASARGIPVARGLGPMATTTAVADPGTEAGIALLEDLHRATSAELATIAAQAVDLAAQPLLAVLTARPIPRRSDLDELLAGLSRDHGALSLELGPLDAGAIGDLVSERARAAGASPGRRADLLDRAAGSGGNPGLMRILLDHPPGSRRDAAVCHWLSFLPVAVRDLLAIASVLEPDCSLEELSALSGISPGQLVPALLEALAAGVLAEHGTRLGFAQQAVAGALYRSLPEPVRSGLHREAARRLASGGSTPVEVARHALLGAAAGDLHSVPSLIQVADQAVAAAPEVAVDLLRQASEIAGPAHPLRDAIASDLAHALFWAGRTPEAEAAFHAALAAAPPPGLEPRLRLGLSQLLLANGRAGEVLREVDRLLATPGLSLRERGQAQGRLALARFLLGDLAGAAGAAGLAESDADRAGDPVGLCQSLLAQAALSDAMGRLEHAEAAVRLVAKLLSTSPEPELRRLEPQLVVAQALMEVDRLGEAGEAVERGLADIDRYGPRGTSGSLAAVGTLIHFCAGDWDRALVAAHEALHLPEEGAPAWTMPARAAAVLVGTHRGSVEPSDELLSFGQADLSDLSDLADPPEAAPRYGLEWIALAQVALLESMGHAEAGLRLLAGVWTRCTERSLLGPALTLGPSLARRLAAAPGVAGVRPEEVAVTMAYLAAENPRLDRAAAGAALCRSIATENPALGMEALERMAASPRVLERSWAQEDVALLLARLGHTTTARRVWAEAVTGYESLGAGRRIRQATGQLRALGVRGRTSPVSGRRPAFGWSALTPAELRVVDLLAGGLTNSQIGEELFISPHTVHTHVSHVLRKLKLDSRVSLASYAARHRVPGQDFATSRQNIVRSGDRF